MMRLRVLTVAGDERADEHRLANRREAKLPLRDVAEPTLECELRFGLREAVGLAPELLFPFGATDEVSDVPGHAVLERAAVNAVAHGAFPLPVERGHRQRSPRSRAAARCSNVTRRNTTRRPNRTAGT